MQGLNGMDGLLIYGGMFLGLVCAAVGLGVLALALLLNGRSMLRTRSNLKAIEEDQREGLRQELGEIVDETDALLKRLLNTDPH